MAATVRPPGQIPIEKSETERAAIDRLTSFRERLRRHTYKYWTTPEDLTLLIVASLAQESNLRPGEGWVRGGLAKTTEDLEKVNQMHEKIRDLELEVSQLREQLATTSDCGIPGGDVPMAFELTASNRSSPMSVETTLNDVLRVLGGLMLSRVTENYIKKALKEFFTSLAPEAIFEVWKGNYAEPEGRFGLAFDTLKIRLVALGLVDITEKALPTSVQTITMWGLTPNGYRVLDRLRSTC